METVPSPYNPNVALNMLWLVLAVLIWGVVHSITASSGAEEWLRRKLGGTGMRFYRFGYNVFSVISFIPILWLMAVLPDQALYRFPAPWVYLTLAGQFAAVVILVVGVLQTGALSFVGLRQLFEKEERPPQLITHGLYRWVRHPLYTAGLLFIWLTPVMSVNLLIVIISATVYIIVGALFEERKLEREFGTVYAEYKSGTPMLIPGLTFGRNK
ncbi:MAG: isoprenylcysteine carboxylmethyltransferase family protein [Anaerolineales bacterium]|nr:isoprenylcysteine carboxylmethyltransferase family protein [Anaerolineales bacterium]